VKRLARALAALPPRDLLLALALTVIDVTTLVPYRSQLHPFWAAVVLVAAQTIPLATRSVWPALTFILVGLPRVAYDLIGLHFAPLPLGPALAYFTVIERCRPPVRRVITVVLVLGMLTSQLKPGHSEPYDISVSALVFLTAWMAGVLSRTRHAYVAEVEARAARAEAERDAETARAALAERTRIARELHDVVAHHVSLMAVQAEAASSLLPSRPADAARVTCRDRDRAGAGSRQWPHGRFRGTGRPAPAQSRHRPGGVPHHPGGADQHRAARQCRECGRDRRL
jgi:signal transduction histidine kinase